MVVGIKIPLRHHFRSSAQKLHSFETRSDNKLKRKSRGKWGGFRREPRNTRRQSSDTQEESSSTKEESSKPQGESSDVVGLKSRFEPPNGWTNDPEEMLTEDAYRDAESEGHELLQHLGLKTAKPIMSETRQNGACLHVLESGGNYYIWNIIEGDFRRFQDTCLTDILDTIRKNDGGTKDCQYAKEITPAIESH